MSQQLMDDFQRLFNLPAAMARFIELVATEDEMRLVVAMNGQTVGEDEIIRLMGWEVEAGQQKVLAAYRRGIIRRTERHGHPPHKYISSTFYDRVGHLASYEAWQDVPPEVRQDVSDWELAEFVQLWAPSVKEMDTNPEAYRRMLNHDFLLLSEALEVVDAADAWAVTVCDCRAITRGCDQPAYSCIRLGEGARMGMERGNHKSLTHQECRDLVIRLDKRGLMHTGDYRWRERGSSFGFCNCCTCDCFPARAALAFGLRTRFPRMHWIAAKDEEKCTNCGVCVKRCYYGAHSFDGTTVMVKGKERRHVEFDPDKCWGCGLCATGCQYEALSMVPVEAGLTQDVFASDTARKYFERVAAEAAPSG